MTAWLPEGNWIDFFDGTLYSGGKTMRLFRGLERQPVLAREGAIVPMAVITSYSIHYTKLYDPGHGTGA